mmetsp:Transcript_2041/g.4765  ORF Transcript_2041/g.4765 Transcript_2041/m.4765 type:complete len:339 (-) Transcript_2041:423-1439(-)
MVDPKLSEISTSAVCAGPYYPTSAGTVDDLVSLLASVRLISPSDCFVDLGAGDGRVVRRMAEQFGCRAVGVEYDESVLRASQEFVFVFDPGVEDIQEKGRKKIRMWLLDPPASKELMDSSPDDDHGAGAAEPEFLCCDLFALFPRTKGGNTTAEVASRENFCYASEGLLRRWRHQQLSLRGGETPTAAHAGRAASVRDTEAEVEQQPRGALQYLMTQPPQPHDHDQELVQELDPLLPLLTRDATVVFVYLLPEFHAVLSKCLLDLFQEPNSKLRLVIAWWWPLAPEVMRCWKSFQLGKSEGADSGTVFLYTRAEQQRSGGLDEVECDHYGCWDPDGGL